jgi:hypothetical protein
MLQSNVRELRTVVTDTFGNVTLTNYLDDLGVDGITIYM